MAKEINVTRHDDGSYTVILDGKTVMLPDEKSFLSFLAELAV